MRTSPYDCSMMTHATQMYLRAVTWFRVTLDREEGASMVEYALLITLIALVAVAGVTVLGQALGDQYDMIATRVRDA